MRKARRQERGFTMLEMVLVIAIMLVLGGMAIIQSFGSFEGYQVNSATDTVASQLRLARQLAISQRRNVQVRINSASTPPTVSYQILPRPGSSDPAQAAVTSVIPKQTTFTQETGVPDTPMAFGTCGGAGVCIAGVGGGPAFMQFTSTGQFTDATGVTPINGTIFIGVPNQKPTARAVTVMGGTGRVRPYYYVGGTTAWTE
ncbi:MAG TPA: prepilin-type N-terminal cleavage/methylation domain-containing protein [Dongiaceae bacterium]|nr:prepilin-type N-terminal cleavage/methylation domain-containing protein [Dongiaceae bacterium]